MSTKTPFEHMNEFNQLTTAITQRTTEYFAGVLNEMLTDTVKLAGELGQIKKIDDLFASQMCIASEASRKLAERSQAALQMWQANSAQVNQFIENCTGQMNTINPMNFMNPGKTSSTASKRA